ncbi:hypothetical protein PHMEG_0003461 [Phytophthora megakarya]|uniref:Uncharacterized protein n=1 Tax=Phytophthora megakarya TaxID=4795 RepID=A0A225WYM0_9STRA|nr:hypothetical protein PHMEG_0003461 [Phytophthora megakarya]
MDGKCSKPGPAYGSAAKLDHDKCERAISRSNFSKHKKKCKGIRVRESRSEIRKRSWVKHRAKRVGDQRSRRAAQENAVLSAHVQMMIDGFGEGKNCTCLAEFEEIYKAGFVEKDKANVAKMKAKHVENEGGSPTHVIKKETRDVYGSYFKKFCEFCLDNEYPDPAAVRHHELPSLLVAFMESVSASKFVSNQTAEKIRAAVANYYGSYERRDAAGPDKGMVVTDDQGNNYGLGNPAKDAYVRRFMRGLKKRKSTEFTQRQATPISLDMLPLLHCHLASSTGFAEVCRLWFVAVSAFAFYGMCRINEVPTLQWKKLTLGLTRRSTTDPSISITFGTYKLEGRKTEVTEGRCYNLHSLESHETPMDAFSHLSAWLRYVETKTDHKWSDTDDVFRRCQK